MGLSFNRKRGGAWMRGWKNWALSVARASLPTVLDVRLWIVQGFGLIKFSSMNLWKRIHSRKVSPFNIPGDWHTASRMNSLPQRARNFQ